jgi:AcrR family transcriptional regulator
MAEIQERTRPTGRVEVVTALLEAAERLFSERGPNSVSLRQIAAEAGVNFGLVYQHIGTRDNLLRAVFRHVSERASSVLSQASTYQEAFRALRRSNPGDHYARMRAWAILERFEPEKTVNDTPPSTEVLVQRARDELERLGKPHKRSDAEVVTAVALSMHLGWKFFGPSLVSKASARDRKYAEQLAERVVDTIPTHVS